MGSPGTVEEGGETMGSGRGESGERSEVHARSSLTSTVPKARSRSRGVATLDEVPRISLRVSQITNIDIVVVVISHYSARTDISMPVYDGGIRANICFLVDSVRERRNGEARDSRRRCDTILDFA